MQPNSATDEIIQHSNNVNSANMSETGSEQDPRNSETKLDGMKAHIETWWTFFGQSSLPFFISGIGLIAAGLFFERAQHWAFFTNIPEVVVLVPALLGLKGNLETTYASRLSTLSNKGELETNDEILWTLAYNICLIETQAIVMSFFAAIISVALSLIRYNFELRHAILVIASAMSAAAIASILLACLIAAVVVLSSKCGINPDNVSSPIAASIGDLITLAALFELRHAILVIASAMSAAAIASILLACLIAAVVVLSSKCGINPDNVSSPIAASIGDLITLAALFELRHAILVIASAMSAAAIASILLACLIAAVVVLSSKCGINPDNVSSPIAASIGDLITLAALVGAGSLMLPTCTEQQCLFSLAIAVGILLVTPMLSYFAISTENTKGVLLYGWWSIVVAALIGCGGGLILQKAVIVFPGLAVFHPLITGLGGNRVSVQSSRQCTSLHICGYPLGTLPDHTSVWTYLNPFRVFCAPGLDSKVAIVILFGAAPFNVFFVILIFLTAKNVHFTWTFVGAYILFAFVQLAILLYLCQVIVHILWEIGYDPDDSSTPLLTATSDLLGTGLLYTLFLFLQRFAPYAICIQMLDEPLITTTSMNFTSGT
uniref:MgtE domain-containing protein n=1 Tax=Ascaris lumbricoides TaxID=6252 RepID=A0A0M3I6A7_ASCLU